MTVANANASSQKRARKSGIVVPRKLKWHQHLAAWLIYAAFRCVSATWRCRFTNEMGADGQENGPFIFALWHNRLALSMTAWNGYARKRYPAAGLVALISASHDGGILARALRYFDVEAARGSSSRRGAQALLELTTFTERGYHAAITPDGPRGPRYVMQDGVLGLAQVTGLPICPVSVHVRGKLTVKKSWDQFQIPLPFARCELTFGPLVRVPKDITDAQRDELKAELQRRMMELTRD